MLLNIELKNKGGIIRGKILFFVFCFEEDMGNK